MDKIWNTIAEKKNILILGFGREGQSTYSFIRAHDAGRMLTIADASEAVKMNPLVQNDSCVMYSTGRDYLANLEGYDCIIKTPGISLRDEALRATKGRLTSQAALFLEVFRDQTVGITGTKGKSTASAFIHHVLSVSGRDAVLLGNIGVPPFDRLAEITPRTIVVFELSSHMLQTVTVSPHIGLLLNIFPEHLDYYETMERYVESKAKIFQYAAESDILVFDTDAGVLDALEKFGTSAMRISWTTEPNTVCRFAPREKEGTLTIRDGEQEVLFYDSSVRTAINGMHVLRSLALAAVAACYAGGDVSAASAALRTFQGLPHRLQPVGTWRGVTFINDSISTIPESARAALLAFPRTNVLIVGGLDRGVSYSGLIRTIEQYPDLRVLCIDETGERMYREIAAHDGDPQKYFLLKNLELAVEKAYDLLPNGGLVLLSPAAASYTNFKNFEERGRAFALYAQKYGV